MSDFIGTLMAEAELPETEGIEAEVAEAPEVRRKRGGPSAKELASLGEHNFRAATAKPSEVEEEAEESEEQLEAQVSDALEEGLASEFFEITDAAAQQYERKRERKIYRARTVRMLRTYMKYSLETGRVPALVGQEFFASNVTKYRVQTFEDRVIFVHDMETCLGKLDEFSRQVLARVVLQEYEHEEAAVLFGCTRMTVHRKLLEALDQLTQILLSLDLLSAISANSKKSCQEGESDDFCVSGCED